MADPNQHAVLLIHGFVRHLSKTSLIVDGNNHNMLDISNVIQSFHYVSDQWDTSNIEKWNKFRANGDRLTFVDSVGSFDKFANAFGSIKVKIGRSKLWRVQIRSLDAQFWSHTVSLAIGIVDASMIENITPGRNFYASEYGGYAFLAGNGWLTYASVVDSIQTYGAVCRQSDVISMELNMTKPTNCYLKYSVNHIDYGYAFEHIASDENIEYKLAVSMWKADEIRLLE